MRRGLRGGSVTSRISWATRSDGLDSISVPVSGCDGRLHRSQHACMPRYRSCSDCLVFLQSSGKASRLRDDDDEIGYDRARRSRRLRRAIDGHQSWAECPVSLISWADCLLFDGTGERSSTYLDVDTGHKFARLHEEIDLHPIRCLI